MRSVLKDRITVVWIATVLLVWTASLVVLWGLAFDTSGTSILVTLTATLWAVSLAAVVPGRTVRAIRRILRWFRLGDSLPIALAAGGPKSSRRGEAQAMMRLLGVVALLSALGGLGSTGMIFLSQELIDGLTSEMLFSHVTWTLCKLLIQFVGMFPMGLGIALSFLATGMIRLGSGRDVYASLVRDWVLAAPIALVVFLILQYFAVSLLVVGGLCGLGMLLAALVTLQRQVLTLRPGGLRKPVETPGIARRAKTAASFAAIAITVQLQLRLLSDSSGAGPLQSGCWVAGSAVLIWWFLRRMDRRSHMPSRSQMIGARIGIAVSLSLQVGLLIAAIGGTIPVLLSVILAAGAQIPTSALGATIISRQRRLFAYAGGRARGYLSCAAGGAGLGLLGYLLIGSIPGDLSVFPFQMVVMLLGVIILCTVSILSGAVEAKGSGLQSRWTTIGAVLTFAVTAGLLGTTLQATLRTGPVKPGVWLTAAGRRDGESAFLEGTLPHSPQWRGEEIDDALGRILSEGKGRWLVGAVSRRDLPRDIAQGVHMFVCSPDPSSVPPGAWGELPIVAADGDLFSVSLLRRERFDGLLLALLPGDHPDAVKCYNDHTMSRLVKCLQPNARAVLRIRTGESGLGVALAAAKTFQQAVGPCWVVVQHDAHRADILLAGPISRVRRPRTGKGRYVARAKQLWYECPEVRPIRLVHSNSVSWGSPGIRDVIAQLRNVQPYWAR